jgi:hypothetical protein
MTKTNIMEHLKITLFTFLFILPLLTYAQDSSKVDLNDDWEFLTKSRDHYQEWLESNTELTKVIRVTNLIIHSPNLVVLDLEITNGADWVSLRDKYAERNGTDLSRMLFNKFLFLSELGRKQAGIRIRSAEKDYYVDMRYKDSNLITHESKLKGSVKGTVTIDAMKLPKSLKGKGVDTMEETKKQLIEYFKGYYDEKKGFFYDANFKVLNDEKVEDTHYLEFSIWNISNEVLYDFAIGYYERISIIITLKEDKGSVTILYEIQAKYGAGLFKAPRRSDYKDVEINYKEYLDEYGKGFKSKIKEAIHNN